MLVSVDVCVLFFFIIYLCIFVLLYVLLLVLYVFLSTYPFAYHRTCCYFSPEPTVLVVLGKRVLDQIYYNNKAKLCEIRIRMMGTEVDLLHAIDHPKGSQLFNEYLTRQHAQENLAFYTAVDRYDTMCKSVSKIYTQVLKMRARAVSADAGTVGLDEAQQPLPQRQTTTMPTNANAMQGGALINTRIEEESPSQANSTKLYESHNSSAHSLNTSALNSNNNSANLISIQPSATNFNSLNTSFNNMSTNTSTSNMGIADSPEDRLAQFQIKAKPQSSTNNALFASHKILIQEVDDSSEPDPDQEADVMHSDSELSMRQHMIHSAAPFSSVPYAKNSAVYDSPQSDFITQEPSPVTPVMASVDKDISLGTLFNVPTPISTDSRIVGIANLHGTTEPANMEGRTVNDAEKKILANHSNEMVTAHTASGQLSTGIEEGTSTSTNATAKQRFHRSSFLKSKADTLESALIYDQELSRLQQGDESPESEALGSRVELPTTYESATQQRAGDGEEFIKNNSNTDINHSNNNNINNMDTVTETAAVESAQESAERIRRHTYKMQQSIVELKEAARLLMETYILEGSPSQLNLPGLMRLRAEKTFNLWCHQPTNFNLSAISTSARARGEIAIPVRQNSFLLFESADAESTYNDDHLKQQSQLLYASSETENTFKNSMVHSMFMPAPINTNPAFGTTAQSQYSAQYKAPAESPSNHPVLPVSSQSVDESMYINTYNDMPIEGLDICFIDLFKEVKQEILKLLRDDKFPRWKSTPEFQNFIASIRPYEKDREPRYAKEKEEHTNSDKERSIDSRSLRQSI